MSENELLAALAGIDVPSVRYFETIGSTNTEALNWAENEAEEYSLVFANHQSSGRGRLDRHWVSQPGSSLAFSLIFLPTPSEAELLQLFSPLGAIAVATALRSVLGIQGVEVKWPNDVLIHRRKVCGILAESLWLGDSPYRMVIGIGINITPDSVPPPEEVLFPAACIEGELGRPVDRFAFLASVIKEVIAWRKHLGSTSFKETWESQLAFKGELVRVEEEGQTTVTGRLDGINQEGHLRIFTPEMKWVEVAFGDVSLRSVGQKDRPSSGNSPFIEEPQSPETSPPLDNEGLTDRSRRRRRQRQTSVGSRHFLGMSAVQRFVIALLLFFLLCLLSAFFLTLAGKMTPPFI